MKNAVVLMTALVPTIGHKALIEFAADFVNGGFVNVILSSRSFEPEEGIVRLMSLERSVDRDNVFFHLHSDDNAPQNPVTDEEWDYWKSVCDGFNGGMEHTHLIASEPYGKKMAEVIGAEFIPFDIERRIFPVKGSDVRMNLHNNFSDIIPEYQKFLRKRITTFGQESCGKTTLANTLGHTFDCPVVTEFARPYLELMDDKTVTDAKMANIVAGQYAMMNTADNGSNAIFTFRDTDLLSTIGYYRIYGGNSEGTNIEELFEYSKADLYLVCPDNIPFEPDPLRYGGAVRESTMQFWIDLLEEFNCEYVILTESDKVKRLIEAHRIVTRYYDKWFGPLMDFKRD